MIVRSKQGCSFGSIRGATKFLRMVDLLASFPTSMEISFLETGIQHRNVIVLAFLVEEATRRVGCCKHDQCTCLSHLA